jgi:hypothetical protein
MFKTLCQSIGLASLLLIMNYGDLLGGGADVRMHVPFELRGIVAAQLLDILILGLSIFAVLAVLKLTRYFSWARTVLAILAPPYLLFRLQTLLPFVVRDGLVPVLAGVWAALILLLLLKVPRWYKRLLRLGDAAGIFLAFFALCNVAQLIWVAAWNPVPHERVASWQHDKPIARMHPLLVWVVFDELSYDQLFEHRAHDLALPNFDALRSQSILFTDVQPVGYKTVKILPSLLSGKPVDDFRYTFHNKFLVHYSDERGWHALDGSGTVFHDAQQQGWRTAVVGWYNPYCTIYGDALDSCYWNNLDRIDGLMSQRSSVLRNTLWPLRQLVFDAGSPARAERAACNYDVRQRLTTQLDLAQHSMQLLQTDQADFVFLHLAIPHSPNIWSRLDGAYTDHCDSSYLDNLALVDRTLGEMLKKLQASPRWKDTTLIVEGDHGWRIDLWNWLPSWTDEDDEASRGVFDPRPALIVHEAGETAPRTVATAWPLIDVHNLVEQVLRGRPINTAP